MLVEVRVRTQRTDPYAWEIWSAFAGGHLCPYCGHRGVRHTMHIGQPFIYTEEKGGELRRRPVTKKRQAARVLCHDCAKDLSTEMAVCYMERHGTGEVLLADGRVVYPDGVVARP